jgi:hypothetical protein
MFCNAQFARDQVPESCPENEAFIEIVHSYVYRRFFLYNLLSSYIVDIFVVQFPLCLRHCDFYSTV